MERIIKEVREIENEFPGYHTLIVLVNAGGNDFVECYVGVNKDSNFWSKYQSITLRDRRFQVVEKLGFELYGSRKEFDHCVNIEKLRPLDGAWLSFSRSGSCYEFLKDDLFYYGTGFLVRPHYENLSEENNIEAAEVQITRILKVLTNEHNDVGLQAEAEEDDIWEFIEKSNYFNKTLYSWISHNYEIKSIKICKESARIILYDFSQKYNQKIWQIHGTGIFIRADGKIYEDIKYDHDFPKNHYWSFEDAVVARATRAKLHYSDINTLTALMGNFFLNKEYWRDLVNKTAEQKINKSEKNNLKSLLLLLKNNLLDKDFNDDKYR